MATKISELKTALKAGARASKYRVNVAFPSAIPIKSDLSKADLLCKAASFPSMTIGQIEVWNQGRKLVIPGDTSFDNTWTLTFYNTEDHGLRKDMISWLVSADNFQKNTHSGNPEAVLGIMSVVQLDSAGEETVKYTFHNVYVQSVGEISLGDDSSDTIEEFDVTLSFTDWVVGDGEETDPSAGSAASNNDIA